MGRFHLRSDDDSDDDSVLNNSGSWEIVSDPRTEGSLVEYQGNSPDAKNDNIPQIGPESTKRNQPIYFMVQNPYNRMIPHESDEDDWTRLQHPYNGMIPHESDEEDWTRRVEKRRAGRCCGCGLWCLLVSISIVSMLLYYIMAKGPPGPPPAEICGVLTLGVMDTAYCPSPSGVTGEDETPLETWQDFTSKHNVALIRSLRAYLVDTTWHVLSWVIPQMVSDIQSGLKDFREGFYHPPKKCALALNPPSAEHDLYHQLAGRFPIATSHSHAVLSFVQKLETFMLYQAAATLATKTTTTRNPKQKPLFFWASQMTPGLAIPELTKQLVDMVLPSCPPEQLPFVSLEVTDHTLNSKAAPQHSEHQAMEWLNKIRRRTQAWKSGGGVVVLEQADRLPPEVLRRLIEILESGAGDESMEQSDYVERITQNIVFVFTSEKVGRQSMGRHLKLKGSVADVALSSLALDIRHEISVHMGMASPASLKNMNILPFWFLTRDDMEKATKQLLNSIATSYGLNRLVLSEEALHELTSDKRIEFVRWSLPGASSDSVPQTLSISTHGISPLLDLIRILESKLVKNCKFQNNVLTGGTYYLDFRKATQQLELRTETCERSDACPDVCSFKF